MADFHYNEAAKKVYDQTLDMVADAAVKVGLSTSVHVPIRDDDFLDEVGADDFIDGELTGTGYTSGFGNSGRKALASRAIVVDKPNNRAEFDAADVTWTGIDAGTAAQATIMKEITNDAASITIANIDSGGFPIVTNGGDLTIQWNAEGIIQLRTT
ncbi:hypothetical protein LCGC14_0909900 [marine sediment metagenome]|uniref:Uncharacterized protein n=1 Tax=marine sediment metagenome TaxID=412755 RepID=A0A0F9PEP0_9ZZZZ